MLCWGYTGILSLGQGVFFGLGGYCMAMFLKLEASSVANTKIQSTPGIPDFMDWNQITALPFFWVPFKSLPFTLDRDHRSCPSIAAFILSFAMFKRRVGGVYFAIITQALCRGADHPDHRPAGLYRRHQRHHRSAHAARLGHPHRPAPNTSSISSAARCLLGSMLLGRFVLGSKLGRILVAIRDKEDRVRFSGYDVANFKVFVFCLAAAIAAVGGAMFTLQVGFMSPSFVGIVPSIEMVIFCAVGGRQSLVGAVVGTLLVNWAQDQLLRELPGTVAVRDGRPVHRGRAGFPARPRRSRSPIRSCRASSGRRRHRRRHAASRRRPNEE